MKNLATIEKVLQLLAANKLIYPPKSSEIYNYTDEIYFNEYSLHLKTNSPYFVKNNLPMLKKKISASGISLNNNEEALVKCVSEFVERFSLVYYDKNILKYETRSKIPDAISLSQYNGDGFDRRTKFSWVEGVSLSDKRKVHIPAQLVFLYNYYHDSLRLTTGISTGAACTFHKRRSLLSGICEIIERDAFMTAFLLKLKVPRIDIKSIDEETIQLLYEKCERFNLEMYLFEITNDISIPAYMTILIDRTGVGPAVSIGAKASLQRTKAIIGSMEESFMGRSWMRSLMMKGKHNSYRRKRKIVDSVHHGLLWSNMFMIMEIDYLLSQKAVVYEYNKDIMGESISSSLAKVQNILQVKGFDIYYADITHDMFKQFGYSVIRSVIPGLQPLFINEQERELNIERLKTVSAFCNQKELVVNQIPHPFL